MTHRIESCILFNMTHSFEPFFFNIDSWKLNPLFEHVSKNWTIFLSRKISHRVGPFKKYDSKNWTLFSKLLNEFDFFFWNILKELNNSFFSYMTQRIQHSLFSNVTQKNFNTFFEYDSQSIFFTWFKELNIFRKCNSKNLFSFWKLLNFSLKIYSKNRSFTFSKWVKELDLFFLECDSKNTSVKYDSNGTFFSSKYDTQSWTFFEHDSRIFFFLKKKLTETAQRIEHFFDMTQRIVFFFKKKDSKISQKRRLNELNSFWRKKKHDSKNWGSFEYDSDIFFKKLTLRTDFFLKKSDSEKLNLFFQFYSKNWIFFTTTQRIEPFNNTTQRFCSSNKTHKFNFFEYDSMNWTFLYDSKHSTFVFKKTQISEPFSIWL